MRQRLNRICALGLVLAIGPLTALAQDLELISDLQLRSDATQFGGLSAIAMAPDGQSMNLLSDRGYLLRAEIIRADGTATNLSLGPIRTLRGQDGSRAELRGQRDSEGLAFGPNDTLYVSFEGDHRLALHSLTGALIAAIPPHPDFAHLQVNASLEALAVDLAGQLFTLPERSGDWAVPFPVYRFANGAWQPNFSIPRRGRYLAVGADIGPDGRFYLLERDFRGLFGFSTRIRRFDINDDGFVDEETLLVTSPGVHGNLEGISIWQSGDGHLIASMISDDNFSGWLKTEFVEYRLPD
ncbi:MAG: hypothetical protein ACI81Q_002366 [Paracoccaceae bacterium]|jgi:hypothetical protein